MMIKINNVDFNEQCRVESQLLTSGILQFLYRAIKNAYATQKSATLLLLDFFVVPYADCYSVSFADVPVHAKQSYKMCVR